MALTERGKVQDGSIIFSRPLELPEGTEVMVRIEPLVQSDQSADRPDAEDFASQPFFGMWADREEMTDSTTWVRKEREQWQQRLPRQD